MDKGVWLDCEVTTVEFCVMTDKEIRSYVATKEPMDKAGAYGIQGGAARFVSRIDGCYYNVWVCLYTDSMRF